MHMHIEDMFGLRRSIAWDAWSDCIDALHEAQGYLSTCTIMLDHAQVDSGKAGELLELSAESCKKARKHFTRARSVRSSKRTTPKS